MDVNYTALVRKQIEDISRMQKELKRDRLVVDAELKKIENLLNKKISQRDKQILEDHKKVYKQNIKEIEFSLSETDKIINRLKIEVKPRAQIQITKKLV